MLIGTYRHSIDAKNRMRVPFKFKSALGENAVMTMGDAENIFLFSAEEFKVLYNKLNALPLFDSEAQKPARKFLASAFEAEEDAQGRVLIAKELIAHAKITKNIVFVGVGNRVEIWAEEIWDKKSKEDSVNFEVLAKFGV